MAVGGISQLSMRHWRPRMLAATLIALSATLSVARCGMNYSFPPHFLFGAATAAYQIEGGWNEGGKQYCTLYHNTLTRIIWDKLSTSTARLWRHVLKVVDVVDTGIVPVLETACCSETSVSSCKTADHHKSDSGLYSQKKWTAVL